MSTAIERDSNKHNRQRRYKYSVDPSYREEKVLISREHYRVTHNVQLVSCLSRIRRLGQYGTTRKVHFKDKTRRLLTFTMAELAEIIGVVTPVLYRWRAKGLLPSPIYWASAIISKEGVEGGAYELSQEVYLNAEVHAIVGVIGKHQQTVKYYRASDTDTTDKLFAAVKLARTPL